MLNSNADNNARTLYLFLDESGNYDFSSNGTEYLVFTCMATNRPTKCVLELYNLKHQLMISRLVTEKYKLERFHASEDKQLVRDQVFQILEGSDHFTVDAIVVRKRTINQQLRHIHILYPMVYCRLLEHVLSSNCMNGFDNLVILTDTIGVKRKRNTVEKALKQGLGHILPDNINYTILHHSSKSHFYLQLVDYCSWAIYVKWERDEHRPYQMIDKNIRSEFEIKNDPPN